MSEQRYVFPLLEGFQLGHTDHARPGVECYGATHMDSEKRCVVKRISLPAAQLQAQALLLTGIFNGPEAVTAYYEGMAKAVCKEVEVLELLADRRGFVPFEGHQVTAMEEGIGWHVHLLAPYRDTLAKALETGPMTERGALQLGVDLCAALSCSRDAGWMYVALKPENVCLTPGESARICDIGFVSMDALKLSSLPDRCRSVYTAPEVADAYAQLSATMDIYALGLTLYQVYNGGKLPFDGAEEREVWLQGLAEGQAMAAPQFADEELAAILLKACAYDPGERYQTPTQFAQALLQYLQSHELGDKLLAQPEEASEETAEEAPEEAPAEEAPAAGEPEQPEEPEQPSVQVAAKPKRKFPWKLLGLLVLALTAVGLWLDYNYYYLQTIDTLTCVGQGNSLTVTVQSSLEDKDLLVLCTDHYGNTETGRLQQGTVTFDDLMPGTQYIITLEPTGHRRLEGQTTAAYSTPEQTRVLHLTAVIGQEAGSVILSFGVEGGDYESWTVKCETEGQDPLEVTFEEHTVTLTGLTVGAEYVFTLSAAGELTGQTTLTHVAAAPAQPEGLKVVSHEDGVLTIAWEAPEDAEVTGWMVHCFDDAVYDQLLECGEPTASFAGVTPGSVYTIEVTAAGHTLGRRLEFEAKP